MIGYLLFCTLWSKPDLKLVQVPVNESATADVNEDFGNFHFEGSVNQGRMNSVKIVHIPSRFYTEAYAPDDGMQTSLYVKLEMDQVAASLTCDLRASNGEAKP